jgi:hypothetical protein
MQSRGRAVAGQLQADAGQRECICRADAGQMQGRWRAEEGQSRASQVRAGQVRAGQVRVGPSSEEQSRAGQRQGRA